MKKRMIGILLLIGGICFCGCGESGMSQGCVGVVEKEGNLTDFIANHSPHTVKTEEDTAYGYVTEQYELYMTAENWEEQKEKLEAGKDPYGFLIVTASDIEQIAEMTGQTEWYKSYEENPEQIPRVELLSEKQDAQFFQRELTLMVCGESNNRSLQEGLAFWVASEMGEENQIDYGLDIDALCENFCISAENTMEHIGRMEDACDYSLFPATRWKYYTGACSFSKYLIDQYGMEVFLSLFRGQDEEVYKAETGKSLDVLKSDWMQYLSRFEDSISEETFTESRNAWYQEHGQENPYSMEKIKVACVGDSITYGTGLTSRNVTNYPHVLGTLLGERYEVKNFGVPASTLMNSGDLPYTAQWEYAASKSYLPDIVLIKLGTNDTKGINWRGIDAFAESFEARVNAYLELESQPEIYLCTPATAVEATFDIRPERVEEIADFVRSYAEEHHMTLIDYNDLTEGHSEWYIWDGIHPNSTGARKMAEKACLTIAANESQKE